MALLTVPDPESRALVSQAFGEIHEMLDVVAHRLDRVVTHGPLNVPQRTQLTAAREAVTRLQHLFRNERARLAEPAP